MGVVSSCGEEDVAAQGDSVSRKPSAPWEILLIIIAPPDTGPGRALPALMRMPSLGPPNVPSSVFHSLAQTGGHSGQWLHILVHRGVNPLGSWLNVQILRPPGRLSLWESGPGLSAFPRPLRDGGGRRTLGSPALDGGGRSRGCGRPTGR